MKKEIVKFTAATAADRAQVLALLEEIGDDGHTIWAPAVFDCMGARAAGLKERFNERQKSGPGKFGITSGGTPVAELVGVYGLTVLHALAGDIGVTEDTGALGRGTAARLVTAAIRRKLEWMDCKVRTS